MTQEFLKDKIFLQQQFSSKKKQTSSKKHFTKIGVAEKHPFSKINLYFLLETQL